jgi:hypothetical protein
MDYTDLPEDLGKRDVALPPQSARIESRWVQLKHPIEELLGGRMSLEKTFNVIFPLGIVPKKLLLSNCIRRQIPLHFERRYSTLPVFFECEGIAGYMGSLYYFGRNRRSAITTLVERIQLKYLCYERTCGSPALCLSHLFYPHLRDSPRVFPESLGLFCSSTPSRASVSLRILWSPQ